MEHGTWNQPVVSGVTEYNTDKYYVVLSNRQVMQLAYNIHKGKYVLRTKVYMNLNLGYEIKNWI